MTENQETIINGYNFKYEIGSGNFGRVYLCTKNNQQFAIKAIDREIIKG